MAGADLAEAGPLEVLGSATLGALHFGPHNAVGLALLVGLILFTTTLAVLYVGERSRWTRQEQALAAEVAALRGASDRADVLLGSEAQIVASWSGRDQDPTLDGDPTILGERASLKRALAFGAWLPAAQASQLENALERLRGRGEAFSLTGETLQGRFIEAEGRTFGGRALLRLRDVSGARLELLRATRERDAARGALEATRAVLDAIPQPVWLRDAEGRIAWANQAYLSALEAKDLDEVRDKRLDLLDRHTRDEATRKGREGERFSVRVSAVTAGARRALLVNEAPAPGGSAGIAVDVSEVEAARADLQRQADSHVRMLDQLSTAVAMFDAKQRLVFHNAAYRQLWALDQGFLDSHPLDGEILDRLRTARKLPEQADFRTWKAGVLAAYRSPEPQETWWYLPDRRTLRVVASPNPQGGLTYLFDDVSERVHLESRYNALMRVQSETLDTLREGVAVFGSDGRLKLFNRAFRDLWRLDPADLAEEPHVDQVVRLCRPLAPQEEPWIEIRGAVAGLPEARLGVACRIELRDGSILDAAAQPLPDGATLLTFTDMTASVNVERALTEKNDALERAARLRDDFVHHVSYELRSPLTNIIGFTQLLGDETVGPLNPRQREYAAYIMRSSGALLAIINDILDLASIDTGSMELAKGSVDIRDTIQAAARGIEDRLVESSVRLEIDAPESIGSFVADGKRVRQILFNLLSNAVGFSSPGQTVRVVARKREGEVTFEVSDQGRGIPPEMIAKVFERFESHALGTRHRGVGLGLSIVRSFVELHGGRVELRSSPGAGTTVVCIFPSDGRTERLAAE